MDEAGKRQQQEPDEDGVTLSREAGPVDSLIAPTHVSHPALPSAAPATSRLPVVDPKHYALGDVFAQGGIGRLHRAQDLRLGRPVALKGLLDPSGPAESRFLTEALVTARLQHPSIVPIYEAGRWPDGEPFYAMKLVSGRSLDELISQALTLSERLALLPHVLAMAEAVAYAHSQRIIHRDLKPANVLVGEFGETVVIDWGLAKELDKEEEAPGSVLGTPAYMPPEQAAGQPVDERADVYALGAILYHLLTGTRPYGGGSVAEVLDQVLSVPPPSLERLQPGVPEELRTIVAQAMAREPARRYRTARELAEDLRRFQTGQLVGAHRYSRLALLRRFIRRHRATLAVAGVALVALATGGVLGLRRILTERDRAELASREATRRADELTLVQARTAVEAQPSRALDWLGSLSQSFSRWGQVRVIAADARARGLATSLRGHTLGINASSISPDGRWLATVSDDRTVRLWDVRGGQGRVLGTHDDEVWRSTFSPGGGLLATTGKDATLRLWDTATGSSRVLRGHTRPSLGVRFSADGRAVFTSGLDGTIRRWDVASGEGLLLGRQEGWITDLVLAPDGRRLATLGRDKGEVWLWDVEGGGGHLLGTQPAPLHAVAFSPRGDTVATASQDGRVRLWNVTTRRARLLEGHTGPVFNVAFFPDGRTLVSRSHDGTVRLWNLTTGNARILEGHEDKPPPLAVSADGRWFATGGRDRLTRLWDARTLQGRTLRGAEDAVTSVAFTPDGRTLAVSGTDGVTRLYPVETSPARVLERPEGPARALAFSPEGVLFVGGDGTSHLWNPDEGDSVESRGQVGQVALARFSPDGLRLATGGADGSVSLWDMASGKSRLLGRHKGAVRCLAFSPDGRWVASGGEDHALRLWAVEGGEGQVLLESGDHVLAVAFSPDGKRLAAGSGDHTVWLQDVAGGEAHQFDVGGVGVLAVAFSPEGDTVLSGSEGDNAVRLWDARTGEARGLLRGHSHQVNHFAFSPDGRRLVTASADRTVRLWDMESGESRVLQGHTREVLLVAFSPDGRRVASASGDGTLRLWPDDLPVEPDALRTWLKQRGSGSPEAER